MLSTHAIQTEDHLCNVNVRVIEDDAADLSPVTAGNTSQHTAWDKVHRQGVA